MAVHDPFARIKQLETQVEYLRARVPRPDDLDYVLTLALGAPNLNREELDTIARVRSTLLEE